MLNHLFSSFKIKHCELKNRIVMPSLASFLIKSDGSITENTVEHYRRRAAGGPAMVIMEACAVSPEGIVSPHQARIFDDRFVEGLSKIAAAMKSEGAVPAVQLHHGGRQISSRVIGRRPLAPSPLPCPAIQGEVEPLTIEGIQELVKKFGDSATRAIEAGFELIEIHGAHGYLINQFLSGYSNIRQDRYGGDLPGRTQFAKEIVQEIRGRVGRDFPISFKISAMEFVKNGLVVEDSIQILKILVDAGIDIVQVSAGNDATPEWISQPMFMEKACLADYARQIRESLAIPVMAVGRINDPFIAEEILAEGKADLVCIGRGLLADPEMPIKAREGRMDEIRTCIACNTCMESIFKNGRVECLVNPAFGREKKMEFHPPEKIRKVMVIGAGPGGLNVAWVAARRGHQVHLFERNSTIGGQLSLGSVPSHKKEIQNLILFLKKQAEKYHVHFHLNTDATLNTVRELDPDVVIVATGSVPMFPAVPGMQNKMVVSAQDIFTEKQTARKKTVVVGGGATGCEVALYLAESGSPVTIIEELPRIGTQLESMTRKVLLKTLLEHNVEIRTGFGLKLIEDSGIVINGNGKDLFIETERVVMATGCRPDDTLYNTIKDLQYEIHRIGDCLEPRNAKAAIYEAAVIGRSI